jgi:hypothetical protein
MGSLPMKSSNISPLCPIHQLLPLVSVTSARMSTLIASPQLYPTGPCGRKSKGWAVPNCRTSRSSLRPSHPVAILRLDHKPIVGSHESPPATPHTTTRLDIPANRHTLCCRPANPGSASIQHARHLVHLRAALRASLLVRETLAQEVYDHPTCSLTRPPRAYVRRRIGISTRLPAVKTDKICPAHLALYAYPRDHWMRPCCRTPRLEC